MDDLYGLCNKKHFKEVYLRMNDWQFRKKAPSTQYMKIKNNKTLRSVYTHIYRKACDKTGGKNKRKIFQELTMKRLFEIIVAICPDDGMVDMLDSKSGVRKDVRVRVPLWVWLR